MTERGLPGMDDAPACPFVAFGDDREARSTSPDHRHRCFAESPPAPRAVAHQEAYCLSSAFPVCPTFQDWARREAAHARAAGDRAPAGPPPGATPSAPEPAAHDLYADWAVPPPPDPAADPSGVPGADPDTGDESVPRNPPRDWAAPPPWATGAAVSGALSARPGAPGTPPVPSRTSEPMPPRPAEGQGLAGSPADRLAAGEVPAAVAWSASATGSAATAPDEELAGLVQGRPTTGAVGAAAAAGLIGAAGSGAGSTASAPPSPSVSSRSTADAYPPPTRTGKRPAVSSTRDSVSGPAWERMQKLEVYPEIKSGSSMRGLPRLALFAGALGIAALVLFMLPAIVGIGGGGTSSSASPSARPSATRSAAPSVVAAPTPVVYVIKKGDTLSKVANRFDVELEDLLAANPDITDPNKISLGQQVIIPTASAAPSTSATPEESEASTAPE